MDTIAKATSDATSASQQNIDAMLRSSRIWASGLQEISKTMAAMAKAQLDNTLAVCKSLSGAKSVSEAIDLHTKHAHASYATAMTNMTAISDATMKLAHETMAPLTSHLTHAG